VESELAKALKIAKDKVKSGHIKDFQLILDVTGMIFIWVSEEAARFSGLSVPMMISDGIFETRDISSEDIKAMILMLAKSGGKYTLSISTPTGIRNLEIEFKPIYVSPERPFLVGSIVRGL